MACEVKVLGMEVTVYILRCSDGSYYTGLTKQEIEATASLGSTMTG